jgi:hypothetical protein
VIGRTKKEGLSFSRGAVRHRTGVNPDLDKFYASVPLRSDELSLGTNVYEKWSLALEQNITKASGSP